MSLTLRNYKSTVTEPQLFNWRRWFMFTVSALLLPIQAETTQSPAHRKGFTASLLLLSLLWLLLWRKVMLWGFGAGDTQPSVAGLRVMTLETLRYFQAFLPFIFVCVCKIQCSRHMTAPISMSLRHPQMLEKEGRRERNKQTEEEKIYVFMYVWKDIIGAVADCSEVWGLHMNKTEVGRKEKNKKTKRQNEEYFIA